MDIYSFFKSLPADYGFSEREKNRERSTRHHELELPRRRQWNDNADDDFVAIDFETTTGLRTSACAVGMVKVIDGEIVQKYYTLINPIRDEYSDREPNVGIHNIPLSIAEKVETFAELFHFIRDFIGNFKLVCHSKAADIAILKQTMDYYGLSGIDTDNVVCTYQLTRKNLKACCEEYNIPLEDHHDALCDAEACAKLYLALIGCPYTPFQTTALPPYAKSNKTYEERHISSDCRKQLADENIEDKTTIFYQSSVVITGVFLAFPDREELARKIQRLGAKINQSISKSTKIVICGTNAGPAKLKKIEELNNSGVIIRVIRELELCQILNAPRPE